MAAPKRARARKSGKVARKSAARWYDSNWFLLLLVAAVFVGVSWWRSQQSPPAEEPVADSDTPPEPPAAAPESPAAPAAPTTVQVSTEPPVSDTASAPISAASGEAVLAQIAAPGALPDITASSGEPSGRTTHLDGTVSYRGLLTDEVVVPTVDRHVCEEHPGGSLRIADGHVAGVLVWVEGVAATDIGPGGTDLEVVGCSLGPPAAVMGVGEPIRLVSRDTVPHPIESGRLLIASLTEASASTEHRFESTGLRRLSCARHPWEQAFVLVVDHPHATATDSDGRFDLGDVSIPASGTISLRLFHPLLGTFEQSVVAEDGRPLDLRIDLTERVR